ncbi:hypothetical protein BJX96DRAFT_146623 [Aspergillus floccosus]
MPFLCISRPQRSPSRTAGSHPVRRISSPHTHQESHSTRVPRPQSIAHAAVHPDTQAPTEPESSSSSQEPAFTWQDIDPPADNLSPSEHKPPHGKTSLPVNDEEMLDSTSEVSSLPGYNDVSGAVVVDWNGLPHFLSPQEELDRNARLQRAVEERMLGLTRQTDFEWERPCHGAVLPRYTPPKDKPHSRSSSRR